MSTKMIRLGDIGKVITGNTPKTSDLQNYASNDICFVKPSDIADESVIYLDDSEFHISEYARATARLLPPQSVLVTCIGIIGKVAINNVECAINQQINAIVPNVHKCLSTYLAYAILNKRTEMRDVANAPVVPILNKTNFSDIKIKLPSLLEQAEIVKRLNAISNLIIHREEQLVKLDQLVKSRFIEMFGECEKEVCIGDVISISRGASPRPISAFITDDEDGVNWIKIGDVSENSLYITKTEEKITPEGAKKSRMVHKGDFILSNSMSFGRPYILGIDGCVHDGWLIMSDFKAAFNELYLYHALRSDEVQCQFSGKVNGATVKNLNSDLVKNTFIKVPALDLQNQFAAFVEQVDKSKVDFALTYKKSVDMLNVLGISLCLTR